MPSALTKLANHARLAARMGPLNYVGFVRDYARPTKAGETRRVVTPRFRSIGNTRVGIRTGSSDRHVLYQVLGREEYAPLVGLDDVKLIVDCGANAGYTTLYFLHHYPHAKVVALECDPENFELLEQNTAPFADRVELRRQAVWYETTGLVVRRDREWSDFGVQVTPPQPGERPDVDAIDLLTLLREVGEERIDILKIDIEGAETPLLSHDTGWLSFVKNLAIELHDEPARSAFERAMRPYDVERIEAEELTICRGIRVKPPMDADERR